MEKELIRMVLHEEANNKINGPMALPDIKEEDPSDFAIMSAMWKTDENVLSEIQNINKVYSSKHGMFAGIPLVCKVDKCAYKDVCMVKPKARILGTRCPMEISAIISRFDQWCKHFGINCDSNYIEDKYLVDATLIKDLVNNEVQCLRAENKIAITGDFMAKTLADIDRKCTPYYEDQITPEAQFLLTLQEKRYKILNLLNATRKDKAQEKNNKLNPSEKSIEIFKQVKEMIKNNDKIIDLDSIDDEMDFEESKITEETIVVEDSKIDENGDEII